MPSFFAFAGFTLLSLPFPAPQEPPLGFLEEYALAEDRDAVLRKLLVESEPWFEFQVRRAHERGELERAAELINQWRERVPGSRALPRAENRDALLRIPRDPGAAFAFLRQRLALSFDVARAPGVSDPSLPTRLDPALVALEAWTKRALAAHPDSLAGFSDSALGWLLEDGRTVGADKGLRHELLQRGPSPDLPGLPALIVRDLEERRSSFGSLDIHRELRLEALEECARLRPGLLGERAFVTTWLARLAPDADADLARQPDERARHLARVRAFAERLPPGFNTLEANVLYHTLRHQLTLGAPSRVDLLAYLALPQARSFASRDLRAPRSEESVDTSDAFGDELAMIGDDEGLLRDCLAALFAREDDITPFAPFLDAEWLRNLLAETRLTQGDADAARWAAMLAPERLRALEERVELSFPPTRREWYGAGDPVALELVTKNVPRLIVRVFALDAFRALIDRRAEIDIDLRLDGLVASEERTHAYAEPALHRVTRRFEFPALAKPGTYVVEFVGGGQVSRALVRKGHLTATERVGAAGHVFQVFDERGEPVRGASLWFGGRDWQPDERGEIRVPFSTDPAAKFAVLHQGERANLFTFRYAPETYELAARAYVPREALIAGAEAKLVLDPRLTLADERVALKLLEEPVLRLVATDLDGRTTTQDVRAIELGDEQELVHVLRVPERLRELSVSLRGHVTTLDGKRVQLESSRTKFSINQIDTLAEIAQPLLLRTPSGYVVELRGKDGELLPGRGIAVRLVHRDFTDPVGVLLRTDERGRCELGELAGIVRVGLAASGGTETDLALVETRAAYPREVHLAAGETLRLPYLGHATRATRASFTLLGNGRDEFARLALADGFLEATGLEPGEHELFLHESGAKIDVRVTRGARRGDWLVGATRTLEASQLRALGLRPPVIEGGNLVVRVDGSRASTRIVVEVQRYLSAWETAFWSRWANPLDSADFSALPSSYQVGRALSPELRYVLERRAVPHFPGNLLPRPSLLLNPLDLALAKGGEYGLAQGGSGGRSSNKTRKGRRPSEATAGTTFSTTTSPNLDFLPASATLLANLRPDAQGIVRVPLTDLGVGPLVTVTALDGDERLQRTLVLAEAPFTPRARHLERALSAEQNLVERRAIEFVPGGKALVLDSTRTARASTLGSLGDVFRVWLAAGSEPELAQFEFLTRWPSLAREEQLALYDRFACHELAFFLHEQDPAFFAEIVRPYLANKLEKTFLDHWLLGDDLAAYLEPWAFDDLNWIERILLAQRVPAQAESIRRALDEAGALLPPDREHERRAFELALEGQALASAASDKGEYKGPSDSVPPGAPGAPALTVAEEEDSEALADLGYSSGEDDAARLAREVEQRRKVATLYRTAGPSRRYVEHQYWHRVRQPGDGFAALVPPRAYWRDYAVAALDRPFASPNVLTADGSLLEQLFALAVLDLPFEAAADETRIEGERRFVTRASARLSVRLERTPAEPAVGATNLLLGENYLRFDEPTVVIDGVPRERYVEDEFLIQTPYLCRVLVTNTSSLARTVELVLQIPQGAVPLRKGFQTRGETVSLAAFSTHALEYAFYFPAAGSFAHYPAQAAEKEALLASGAARTLTVRTEPTRLDTTSWEHVSQAGSTAEVLAFLDAANLGRLELGRIAWRLKEREFYAALLARLRARHHWDEDVWSWSLFHEDVAAAREYLERVANARLDLDVTLETPFLTLDPVRRHWLRQLEIDPLVLPRVFRRVDELDDGSDVARQYRALLESLVARRELASEDWLAVSYCQLQQGRIPEALASFGKVEASALEAQLQYDYLAAYLGFHTGDLATARAVAERHAEHPIAHWRERFTALRAQLAELDGAGVVQAGAGANAHSEPSIELVPEGRNLRVRYDGLSSCELRFAPLDVEVSFSTLPFADGAQGTAVWVQPRLVQALELPAGKSELVVPVPAELARTDLFVEARAAGLSRTSRVLASALDVRTLENRGELVVADAATEKPLAAVYVKCFARLPDGSVRFHKDGYTDLRGRFDYVTLTDDPDLAATRFAVLVMSDELGAEVRELAPPAR